jgi:hypothetical protein
MGLVNRLTFLAAAFITGGGVHAQCTPAWQPLPATGQPNDWVYALQAWDPDGPGPAREVLVIGGNFLSPGTYIAAWNGNEFASIGGGVNGTQRRELRHAAMRAKP